MSKALINRTNNIPYFERDEFLTPFDRVFDQLFETNFPEFVRSVGVKPYQGSAYPKVNIYEYDEKVGIVAEIPGLEKKDLTVEVEDGTLTISGVKHHIKEDEGAKVIRRELKASSFKRNFEIGENLDGENIKAVFKNGVLNIDIPKIEPEKPKKQFVKIS
jgi:HSP20 family protein